MIPANTLVEFHVTSLDVVHSFWAYQLGVKADANPGQDNIAYVKTKAPYELQRSTAPSSAASGTATCSPPGNVVLEGCLRHLDRGRTEAIRPRRPSRFRRTHGRTSQTHKGEVDDRYGDNGAYAAAAAAEACSASTC